MHKQDFPNSAKWYEGIPPVGEGMGNFAGRILLLLVGILRGVISTI